MEGRLIEVDFIIDNDNILVFEPLINYLNWLAMVPIVSAIHTSFHTDVQLAGLVTIVVAKNVKFVRVYALQLTLVVFQVFGIRLRYWVECAVFGFVVIIIALSKIVI